MPSLNVKIAIRWTDLFPEPVHLSEIISSISTFSGPDVFRVLSRTIHFLTSQNLDKGSMDFLLSGMLSPQMIVEIDRARIRYASELLPFSRLQLLSALKLTAMAGKGTRVLENREDRHEFGKRLLQISDLVDRSEAHDWESPQDLIEHPSRVAKKILARSLVENTSDFANHFARYFKIIDEFLPNRINPRGKGKAWMDAVFFQAYKTSMLDCFLVAFGVTILNKQTKPSEFGKKQPALIRDEFFSKMNWRGERIDGALNFLSLDYEDLAVEIMACQEAPFEFDFGVFRRWPLCRHLDQYLVVDSEFLIDNAGEGLLKALERAAGFRKRQLLRSALGLAIEDYVFWLLANSRGDYSERLRRLDEPGKHADIIVTDGPVMSVVEVATVLWNDRERYSNQPEDLSSALERIVSKEFDQLFWSIKHVLRMDHPPRQIIPVIVGWDRGLSFADVQYTLNKHFEKAKRKHLAAISVTDVRISRLVVLPLDDLELISGLITEGQDFKDVMHAIIADDPDGRFGVRNVISGRKFLDPGMGRATGLAWDELKAAVSENFVSEEITGVSTTF